MRNVKRAKVIAETKFLRLLGRDGWHYVERQRTSGVVAIVPVTHDNKLVLVEQYRVPVDCRVIELPAGLAGDLAGSEDEGLEQAARRELLEETGYRAGRLKRLFHGPVSAGLSNEHLTFFLAKNVEQVGAGGGDATETITVHEVPVAGVARWLRRQEKVGKAIDVKVYAGLYALRTH
jgi:ADP-ribose pyrophosphatase